ncbi:MAG: cation:proton antiporter [Candidatus Brocadiales bacterium]
MLIRSTTLTLVVGFFFSEDSLLYAEVQQQAAGVQEVPVSGHDMDPISPIMLGIVIILIAAKIGGELARRFNQPAVLGELMMGILLGNAVFFTGWEFSKFLQENPFLDYFGRFGALILLCRVGIETDVAAMMEAKVSAFLVAVVGVVAPCVLGYPVTLYLLPDAHIHTRLIIVTALCATSIGMTTRVFEDLGKLQIPEARIVLGAAIVDDVLALLILSVVTSIIATGSFALGNALMIAVCAAVFLFGAALASLKFAHILGEYISRFRAEGMKMVWAVSICFLLAYVADGIGLAPIVGAFAAGLILRDIKVTDRQGHEHEMDEMIRPAYLVFVPMFFIIMGAQVRLEAFLDKSAVLLALGISVVAVLGKLLSGLCAVGKNLNRLCIGVAMVPRAEVGLIFASMGLSLGVLNGTTYSAIVIMVMFTTLITPPLLKRTLYTPEEFRAYEREATKYEI